MGKHNVRHQAAALVDIVLNDSHAALIDCLLLKVNQLENVIGDIKETIQIPLQHQDPMAAKIMDSIDSIGDVSSQKNDSLWYIKA